MLRRASFRIVDERARKLLARLGLIATDCGGCTEAELAARLQGPQSSDAAARLLDPFVAAHGALAASLAPANPAIERALAKTRVTVERAVQRFASKLAKISAYENTELVAAVRRLRAWLAPDGEPQERRLGLPSFAARTGDRALIERVLAAVDPFDPTLKELA